MAGKAWQEEQEAGRSCVSCIQEAQTGEEIRKLGKALDP